MSVSHRTPYLPARLFSQKVTLNTFILETGLLWGESYSKLMESRLTVCFTIPIKVAYHILISTSCPKKVKDALVTFEDEVYRLMGLRIRN